MLDAARQTIADHVPRLARLTPGRTGNLSVSRGDRIAITPSGVPYSDISPEAVPVVSNGEQVYGDSPPSSELPLHQAIYEQFDTGAVAHVHSPWATTLAVLEEPLPPVHYMIALAGERVPVAEYATYGTKALGENAVAAMESAASSACLLAHHGLVTTASTADAAIETAVAVESVAQVYCQARAVGTPEPLPDDEIERVAEKFTEYGPDER